MIEEGIAHACESETGYYLRLAIKYDIAFWRLEEPQMTLDKSERPNPAPSLVPWHLDAPQSPWVWLWVP